MNLTFKRQMAIMVVSIEVVGLFYKQIDFPLKSRLRRQVVLNLFDMKIRAKSKSRSHYDKEAGATHKTSMLPV